MRITSKQIKETINFLENIVGEEYIDFNKFEEAIKLIKEVLIQWGEL